MPSGEQFLYFVYLYEREKKTKNPKKKITKHKIQKYCKDPVEDMYKKSFFFEMPRGDSIQCISLYFTFFFYALRVLIFFYCFFVMCTMSANFDYIFACWGQNEKLYFDKRILEFY